MWATSASLSVTRQRQLLESALAALHVQAAIIDSDGTFVYFSDSWQELQHSPKALVTAPLGGNVRVEGIVGHAGLMPGLREALVRVWQRQAAHYTRQLRIDDDAHERWINLEAHRLEQGEVLLLIRDVTDKANRENDLHTQATRDPVTDLPNRRSAWEALEKNIRAVHGGKLSLAVLVCDLDDFKLVNDEFGHAAGDEVLKAVARRWATVIRPQDVLARIGGDEFLLLVPGATDLVDIHTLAGRLTGALAEPIRTSRSQIHARASVGGVFIRSGTARVSAESALERADRALYTAKHNGHQHITVFRSHNSHT